MVDQILLNDTLQKINASLNKRFEKDAELYISKQEEYELKRNLCNEAYGGVVDMARAKGISNDIIVKVIMRNAGVLDVKDMRKFKKELSPILENANYKALTYMMEDVLDNNVYMQRKLRHVLFNYYMSGITSLARINYWRKNEFEFDEVERSVLFKLIIEKTKHKEASKTLKFKIDFILDAFEKYKSLMKGNVFVDLKNTLVEAEKKEFFKFLCKEMEKPTIKDEAYNFILVDAYASYGEEAFNDAISHIKSTSPSSFKQYVKVICKLFWTEKDKFLLTKMFDTVCKVYESPYIKNHVKREIERKVWKKTKNNEVLYGERKAKIDRLMLSVEQIDKSKYATFADVIRDISNDVNPKSIAYFWIGMESPEFEQSILDSFNKLSPAYTGTIQEAYLALFEHSLKKSKIGGLARLCERLSRPLSEYSHSGDDSDCFKELDAIWVEKVVKYKLKGDGIKTYMFEKHYDRVKEWE